MTSNVHSRPNSDDVPIPMWRGDLRSRRLLGIAIIISFLAPSLLTSPETALAAEYNTRLFNVLALQVQIKQNNESLEIPSDWDPVLSMILQHETERLGITDNSWPQRVDAYIDMVKDIESDGVRTAYNPSGAMSYFQFKAASLQTAYVRLGNYLYRYELGGMPAWAKHVRNHPGEIYNLSAERQAVFMILNIMEQDRERGTSYFADFLKGDLEAGKTAYYKYHHTNPDPFTINRTEQKYALYF